ncbi:u2 small nuclear RNA auxiliary factor [Anaeramoeba flamelloides]|uniref:U2 small nuclear RNA auxiliary factor n=1 Tax=Anaeramoeba flamelloides TaxID=1746091 RepID=A0AAV7YY51_9EUKA|nr:u2 small nuclear RNA auxiliary factor [Anaeramoeba flamelloides]
MNNNLQIEKEDQRDRDFQRRANNDTHRINHNSQNNICSFYQNIGACRHGEMCVLDHCIPTFSRTILIPQMYQNPKLKLKERISYTIEKELQNRLDTFYKDIFYELMKYGEIEELMVSDNLTPHLLGHVYVKYVSDLGANRAFKALENKLFNQTTLKPEFSPVVNFDGTRCRANGTSRGCARGDFCNFLHIRDPSPMLLIYLFKDQKEYYEDIERQKELSEKKTRYSDEKLSDEENYKSKNDNNGENDSYSDSQEDNVKK